VNKAPSTVFISYSTDAKPWAEKLSQSLENMGVSTWTDFKSIRPGQRFVDEIQRALDDAQYFLIVVGPKNQVGEWQDREWQGALQHTWTHPDKRIIPVLIDDATLPSFLRNWQSVRMQSGKSESSWIDSIYEVVTGSSGRGAPAKPNTKSSKALKTRFAEIEGLAKQLKSVREQ
jgi:hypothetical protein